MESADPTRPDPKKAEEREALLRSLFAELFQTERSAEVHGAREARRLGASAPGLALREIVAHAARVNRELPGLAEREHLKIGRIGALVGRAFSAVRHGVADRLIDEERSYRGTLLGLHHGIDVVRMIRYVADSAGRVEIGGWCTRWLEAREPLVEQAAHAMSWFAHHPAAALA
jgi:hypothetical protein